MTQTFDTVDYVRLEVENDPVGLANLVKNPNGDLGAWGWQTPVAGSTLASSTSPNRLVFTAPNPSAAAYFYTEPMLMTAGQYASASWAITALSGSSHYRVSFEWLNSSKVLISSSTISGYKNVVAGSQNYGPFLAPALTAYVRLRFDHYGNSSGANPAASATISFNQVTVAKAVLSTDLATTRTNLIPNPSFESGVVTSGWRTDDDHDLGAVTGLAGTPSGSWALRVERNVASGSTWVVAAPNTGDGKAGFPVVANQTYALQAKVRAATTNRSCTATLYWYDSAGALISTIAVGTVTSATGVWTTVSGTATAPSTAVYAGVEILWSSGSAGLGDVQYVDAVMVERAGVVGSYFDSTTPDSGGVDYAGFYQPSQVLTTRTNLCTNPSFEVDMTGWALSPGAGPGTLARVASTGYVGGAYARATTTSTNPYMTAQGPQFPSTGNVRMSAWVKGTAGRKAYMGITRQYSLGGIDSFSSGSGTTSVILTGSWQKVSIVSIFPGGGTYTYAKPSIVLSNATGGAALTVGDILEIDAVLVEDWYSGFERPYFDGSVADSTVDFVALDNGWTGTAHASTSTQGRVATLPYSTATTSYLGYIVPITYSNIMAPAHSIKVHREALNIGTLEATILDVALDPSKSTLIRPGKVCRLMGGEDTTVNVTTSEVLHTNLVPNPSFEVDTASWTGTNGTIARTTAQFLTGVASSSLTCTSPTMVWRTLSGTSGMPVVAGTTYGVTFSVKAATVSRYVSVSMSWYTAAGASLTGTSMLGVTDVTTGWTTYTGYAIAPATAAFAMLNLTVGSSAVAEVHYLDSVIMERCSTQGAIPLTYTDVAPNLVPNPSFEVNTSGWGGYYAHVPTLARVTTPTPQSGVGALSVTATAASATAAATASGTSGFPVVAGRAYEATAYTRAAVTPRAAGTMVVWYNAAGSVVTGAGSFTAGTNSTSAWTRTISTVLIAPAGAVYAQVYVYLNTGAIGEVHYVDAVMMHEVGWPIAPYFDGASTDVAAVIGTPGVSYDWLGTAHNSASTYTQVTITPTPVRAFYPIFTGKITEAKVTYEYKDKTVEASKRARVVLSAVDANAELAQQKRSQTVATLGELPYILEGCGIPWAVGNYGTVSGQVPSATVVAINENASALDQIAVTRDSTRSYAWVDNYGVVKTINPALSVTSPWIAFKDAGLTGTDVSYSDIDLDYDSARCINEVNIKFLRYNPTTGDTDEIPYGPYRNEASIVQWGVRSATFTVAGLSETTTAIPDFGAAVLAANSTPAIRFNGLDFAVQDFATLYAATFMWIHDVVTVVNGSAPLTETPRVTSIDMNIEPDKWMVHLGFEAFGSVSSPTFVPATNDGAGGKTIGQLLRPAGEITLRGMTALPAGWLLCNGASVLVATYPALHAAIGYTYGGAGANFTLPTIASVGTIPYMIRAV